MGIYWEALNVDRKEWLNSPIAAKDKEWMLGRSAALLTFLLLYRWNGDRIVFANDAGGMDEPDPKMNGAQYSPRGGGWREIWKEAVAGFERHMSWMDTQTGKRRRFSFETMDFESAD